MPLASACLLSGISLLAFTRQFSDCNGNGIDDAVDIQNQTSQDCNNDGVPDECQVFAPPVAVDDGCICPNPALIVTFDSGLFIPVLINDMPGSGSLPTHGPTTVDPISQPPQGVQQWNASAGQMFFHHSANDNTCAEFGTGTYRLLDDCGQNSNVARYSIYIAPTNVDCNCNCRPDSSQDVPSGDTNHNFIDDYCDIASGVLPDCNGNGISDYAESTLIDDCDGNGYADCVDVAQGAQDTDGDLIPDVCEDPGQPATTEIASVDELAAVPATSATLPSISADGRYVSFVTSSGLLTAHPANGFKQLYLLDRDKAAFEVVSLGPTGQLGNADTATATISRDGRFVAFDSAASNLVAGDNNNHYDVFLRDRTSATTQLVSRRPDGGISNGDSFRPWISSNGDVVVFVSSSSDLLASGADTNGVQDVFVWTSASSQLVRASVTSSGNQANGLSTNAVISGDGTKIAYSSDGSNIVAGDANGRRDVFVCDRASPSNVALVSLTNTGGQANGNSDRPSLSSDGKRVAFDSEGTTLVAGDTNAAADIFERDLVTNTTTRVSVSSSGGEAHGDSYGPSISGNGASVAFLSIAPDLVSNSPPTTGLQNAYLRDLSQGRTALVSRNDGASPSNGSTTRLAITQDGSSVAFECAGSNMNAHALSALARIYVRDFAPRNRALQLDGSGWARVQKKPCQEFLGSFTIEAWVRVETLAAPQVILSKWFDGERAYEIEITAAGQVQFRISRSDTQDDAGFQDFACGQIPAGEWHHVACVYAYDAATDAGVRTTYIDGVLAGQKASSGVPHPSRSALTIGARDDGAGNHTRRFVGWVDELRMWKSARTLGEIQASINQRLRRDEISIASQSPYSTLVADFGFEPWNHDEPSFGTFRDEHFFNDLSPSSTAHATYDWAGDVPQIVIDCNGNGQPDWLDIQNNAALDVDHDGVLDVCECSITSYCVGAPNSAGSGAVIGSSGTSSLSADDLVLTVSGCPANVPGIFFFGTTPVQTPFANGFRCAGGLKLRFGSSHTDATGFASRAIHYSSLPAGATLVPTDTRYFQFWYRDVAGSGAGTNLSNALKINFCL